jgi:hypothetical protein
MHQALPLVVPSRMVLETVLATPLALALPLLSWMVLQALALSVVLEKATLAPLPTLMLTLTLMLTPTPTRFPKMTTSLTALRFLLIMIATARV